MISRKPDYTSYVTTYADEDNAIDDGVPEYIVSYTVSRVYPMIMPSMNDPGEPASGGEIEITKISPKPTPELEEKILQWLYKTHDYSED